jgi:hypothetical protein
MAEEHMILCLLTEDANLEHGVWKGLFHNADELDYILRHRKTNES